MVDKLATQVVLFAPRFATSVLILLAFWLASMAVQQIIGRLGRRRALST
jgi:hypothetical protein